MESIVCGMLRLIVASWSARVFVFQHTVRTPASRILWPVPGVSEKLAVKYVRISSVRTS
jgi:hypothetical protein